MNSFIGIGNVVVPSEEVHAIQKEDLAGGYMPSHQFGVNAAWWGQGLRMKIGTFNFAPYLTKNRPQNAHIEYYAALFRTIFRQI